MMVQDDARRPGVKFCYSPIFLKYKIENGNRKLILIPLDSKSRRFRGFKFKLASDW